MCMRPIIPQDKSSHFLQFIYKDQQADNTEEEQAQHTAFCVTVMLHFGLMLQPGLFMNLQIEL